MLTALADAAGPDHKSGVSVLEGQLTNRYPMLQIKAARNLWRINQHPGVIAALSTELKRDFVEREAVFTLALVARERPDAAKEAVPLLKKLLDDKDRRIPAALALWRITRDPKITLVLIDTLQQKDEDFQRVQAAYVLAQMGPSASAALPHLRAALKDASLREEAQLALTCIESTDTKEQ